MIVNPCSKCSDYTRQITMVKKDFSEKIRALTIDNQILKVQIERIIKCGNDVSEPNKDIPILNQRIEILSKTNEALERQNKQLQMAKNQSANVCASCNESIRQLHNQVIQSEFFRANSDVQIESEFNYNMETVYKRYLKLETALERERKWSTDIHNKYNKVLPLVDELKFENLDLKNKLQMLENQLKEAGNAKIIDENIIEEPPPSPPPNNKCVKKKGLDCLDKIRKSKFFLQNKKAILSLEKFLLKFPHVPDEKYVQLNMNKIVSAKENPPNKTEIPSRPARINKSISKNVTPQIQISPKYNEKQTNRDEINTSGSNDCDLSDKSLSKERSVCEDINSCKNLTTARYAVTSAKQVSNQSNDMLCDEDIHKNLSDSSSDESNGGINKTDTILLNKRITRQNVTNMKKDFAKKTIKDQSKCLGKDGIHLNVDNNECTNGNGSVADTQKEFISSDSSPPSTLPPLRDDTEKKTYKFTRKRVAAIPKTLFNKKPKLDPKAKSREFVDSSDSESDLINDSNNDLLFNNSKTVTSESIADSRLSSASFHSRKSDPKYLENCKAPDEESMDLQEIHANETPQITDDAFSFNFDEIPFVENTEIFGNIDILDEISDFQDRSDQLSGKQQRSEIDNILPEIKVIPPNSNKHSARPHGSVDIDSRSSSLGMVHEKLIDETPLKALNTLGLSASVDGIDYSNVTQQDDFTFDTSLPLSHISQENIDFIEQISESQRLANSGGVAEENFRQGNGMSDEEIGGDTFHFDSNYSITNIVPMENIDFIEQISDSQLLVNSGGGIGGVPLVDRDETHQSTLGNLTQDIDMSDEEINGEKFHFDNNCSIINVVPVENIDFIEQISASQRLLDSQGDAEENLRMNGGQNCGDAFHFDSNCSITNIVPIENIDFIEQVSASQRLMNSDGGGCVSLADRDATYQSSLENLTQNIEMSDEEIDGGEFHFDNNYSIATMIPAENIDFLDSINMKKNEIVSHQPEIPRISAVITNDSESLISDLQRKPDDMSDNSFGTNTNRSMKSKGIIEQAVGSNFESRISLSGNKLKTVCQSNANEQMEITQDDEGSKNNEYEDPVFDFDNNVSFFHNVFPGNIDFIDTINSQSNENEQIEIVPRCHELNVRITNPTTCLVDTSSTNDSELTRTLPRNDLSATDFESNSKKVDEDNDDVFNFDDNCSLSNIISSENIDFVDTIRTQCQFNQVIHNQPQSDSSAKCIRNDSKCDDEDNEGVFNFDDNCSLSNIIGSENIDFVDTIRTQCQFNQVIHNQPTSDSSAKCIRNDSKCDDEDKEGVFNFDDNCSLSNIICSENIDFVDAVRTQSQSKPSQFTNNRSCDNSEDVDEDIFNFDSNLSIPNIIPVENIDFLDQINSFPVNHSSNNIIRTNQNPKKTNCKPKEKDNLKHQRRQVHQSQTAFSQLKIVNVKDNCKSKIKGQASKIHRFLREILLDKLSIDVAFHSYPFAKNSVRIFDLFCNEFFQLLSELVVQPVIVDLHKFYYQTNNIVYNFLLSSCDLSRGLEIFHSRFVKCLLQLETKTGQNLTYILAMLSVIFRFHRFIEMPNLSITIIIDLLEHSMIPVSMIVYAIDQNISDYFAGNMENNQIAILLTFLKCLLQYENVHSAPVEIQHFNSIESQKFWMALESDNTKESFIAYLRQQMSKNPDCSHLINLLSIVVHNRCNK